MAPDGTVITGTLTAIQTLPGKKDFNHPLDPLTPNEVSSCIHHLQFKLLNTQLCVDRRYNARCSALHCCENRDQGHQIHYFFFVTCAEKSSLGAPWNSPDTWGETRGGCSDCQKGRGRRMFFYLLCSYSRLIFRRLKVHRCCEWVRHGFGRSNALASLHSLYSRSYNAILSSRDQAWNVDILTLLPKEVHSQISVEELLACEAVVKNDPKVQALAKQVGKSTSSSNSYIG